MIIQDILAGFLMISGVIFFLTTAIALLRFPDFFSRMHATSKCLVGGGISIIFGLIIQEGISPLSLRLLLLIIFLLITTPVVGHALTRSAYQYGYLSEMVQDDMKDLKAGNDSND